MFSRLASPWSPPVRDHSDRLLEPAQRIVILDTLLEIYRPILVVMEDQQRRLDIFDMITGNSDGKHPSYPRARL